MANDRRIYGQNEPKARVRVVLQTEKRERMDAIEQLMIRGLSTSKIEKACEDKYGMTKSAVAKYANAIRNQWSDEERTGRLTNKATAQRRLYLHIQKAKENENWSAVSALERLLSDIQGTKDPVEVHLNVDAAVTEATLHVVANLTPEQRIKIVEEQRRLRAIAASVDARTLTTSVQIVEREKSSG